MRCDLYKASCSCTQKEPTENPPERFKGKTTLVAQVCRFVCQAQHIQIDPCLLSSTPNLGCPDSHQPVPVQPDSPSSGQENKVGACLVGYGMQDCP